MANTKKLNARYMEEKIKNGWSYEEFCQDLGIDQQSFDALLKKTFKESLIRYYKKKMESNKKISRKTHNESKTRTVSEIRKDVTENEFESVSKSETENVELDCLRQEEQSLRDLLFNSEIKVKELWDGRNREYQKLKNSRDYFQSIMDQLEKQLKKIEEIKVSLKVYDTEIESTNAQIKETKKRLEEVSENIARLDVVTLFYKADGKIEILGADLQISEGFEFDEIMKKLMEIEFVEDLTGKEIKAIARIIAVASEVMNSTNKEVKFKFEEVSNISGAIELLEEMSKKE